jgi:membrane protein implicated in regulation of membrane protease activity
VDGTARIDFEAMVLIVAIVISLFVPWPWKLLVLGAGIVAEIGEVVWGRRLAKRWRPTTGAEAMIGMRAEVVSAMHPTGQVRVNGELWEARSTAGAETGETVVVRGMDGLTLVVDPLSGGDSSHSDDVGPARLGFAQDEYERKETNGDYKL